MTMDLYVIISEEDYPTTHLRFCIANTGDIFHVLYVTNEGQHLFDYKENLSINKDSKPYPKRASQNYNTPRHTKLLQWV